MNWPRFYLIFSVCLCFSLYTQAQPGTSGYHSSQSWLDLDYAGDGHLGHRMDIHLPVKGRGPFPVVVTIYGSAFFSNHSKAAVFQNGLGQRLLQAGYAVVSINHRSSLDALFPAQLYDVKAAIRFVRANAVPFKLDPSFIGLTGWSSGGHLSAITGTTNGLDLWDENDHTVDLKGSLGAHQDTRSDVHAVVDWFGPTDFLIMDSCGSIMNHNDARSPESSLIGGPIQSNPQRTKLADPCTFVNAQTAPFLIIHGDQDPLVPHCQSEKLYQTLKNAGRNAELIIVKGGGHGPGVMIPVYYDRMITFFDEVRRKGRSH